MRQLVVQTLDRLTTKKAGIVKSKKVSLLTF